MIQFTKYQAAGNTYLIIKDSKVLLTPAQAQIVCDPVFGAGADGVICWKKDQLEEDFVQATIFNPDGSVAEKSGNGLRILATFLFENIFPSADLIKIMSATSITQAKQESDGSILLEMGKVVPQFNPKVLQNHLVTDSYLTLPTPQGNIDGYAVSVGNPHFVIFRPEIDKGIACALGPLVENHSAFPNRTNVQFVYVESDHILRAEIWERGAGYTLSSGSSSCAIAAVAHNLGYCSSSVTIKMPGGELQVKIESDNRVLLRGPVSKVVDGVAYIN